MVVSKRMSLNGPVIRMYGRMWLFLVVQHCIEGRS
jgi:hypothetical protein